MSKKKENKQIEHGNQEEKSSTKKIVSIFIGLDILLVIVVVLLLCLKGCKTPVKQPTEPEVIDMVRVNKITDVFREMVKKNIQYNGFDNDELDKVMAVTYEDNYPDSFSLKLSVTSETKVYYCVVNDYPYDGNKEVLIDYGGFGAQGCTYMGCYRYDDKTDEYVESTGFSCISNPKLDSEGEYIFGSHRDTATMHSYYAYKYSNGQFIEVYWLSSDYSDGEEIWSVNEVEIGRTNNINDLSTINDPVFELFFRKNGSRNPRIVSFVIY